MCRLFGFRSIINSQVHSSLVHAENGLQQMSQRHPDGWGVAYYINESPHLIKSIESALDDHIFNKISAVVTSQTVVAHIRKATQGKTNILNSHPFQYGKWIFAHNGNINNFSEIKDDLHALIIPKFRRHILGETDSEFIFYYILQDIEERLLHKEKDFSYDELKDCVKESILALIGHIGQLTHNNKPIDTENYLTFILTNGDHIVGFNGGQDMYFCTHKTKCPESNTCKHYADICEKAASNKSTVNHLIFSSEMIEGPNVWNTMKPGQLIGVDHNMIFQSEHLDIDFL